MAESGSFAVDADSENLLKILVATDNHLGYNEKDNIRGNDSFVTFEEILQNAVQNDVDFILLGGDLFHDAKPSPNTLQRCMQLLRTYTLGDKPIQLQFLSDQTTNFASSLNQMVNYEDPNMNVAYPVFSIHGNHDDPSGFGRLSALDLLSTNGLINYFGRWTDLTQITVSPILLRKGSTQFALYGLSYIQDCRLARLFEDSKVVLERAYVDELSESNSGTDDGWFNVMVLHQNRADRGPKNFVPERVLPPFIDLFIWGHEHDCRIVPERNTEHTFHVSQPGSSVATSLAEGEALPKHCALLLVHGTEFKLEPIPLRTVRPFVFETLDLGQFENELKFKEKNAPQRVQDFIAARIETMITRAESQRSGHPSQPKLPLIRLRVIYDAEVQMFNAVRFGNQYHGRVANPIDMILFKKNAKRTPTDVMPVDKEAMKQVFENGDINEHVRVEDIVSRYFAEADPSAKLEVLYAKSMNEMCRRLVDHDDDDAMETILKYHHKRGCDFLNGRMPAKEDVLDVIAELELQADDIFEGAMQQLDSRGTRGNTVCVPVPVEATTINSMDPAFAAIKKTTVATTKPTTAASKRQPTAAAAKATAGRGRGASSRSSARNASNKNELNVSITSTSKVQTTLMSSFASQSTRQTARNAPTRARVPTQYISDSE